MENGGVISKQLSRRRTNTAKRRVGGLSGKAESPRMCDDEWNWKAVGNSFVVFDENSLRLV